MRDERRQGEQDGAKGTRAKGAAHTVRSSGAHPATIGTDTKNKLESAIHCERGSQYQFVQVGTPEEASVHQECGHQRDKRTRRLQRQPHISPLVYQVQLRQRWKATVPHRRSPRHGRYRAVIPHHTAASSTPGRVCPRPAAQFHPLIHYGQAPARSAQHPFSPPPAKVPSSGPRPQFRPDLRPGRRKLPATVPLSTGCREVT